MTHPSPAVVDDGLVERARELLAIWNAAPFGEISKQEHDAYHELMKMGPNLARILVERQAAASDRDVLVGENERLRETLKGIERIAENHTGISGARSLQTAMHAISHAARAALIPLAEEL